MSANPVPDTKGLSARDPLVIIAGIRQFGLAPDGTDLRDLESTFSLARREREEMDAALRELHAMVWGECPSLLNEDSGGSARLDLKIRALLEEAAPSSPSPRETNISNEAVADIAQVLRDHLFTDEVCNEKGRLIVKITGIDAAAHAILARLAASPREEELAEQLHYANGVADLAMKHRNIAETALEEEQKRRQR